jgi:hypothetical protein
MKKSIYYLIFTLTVVLIFFTTILATVGIESNKFNNLISNKINQINNNLNLQLTTIKYKLDIREISLFLDTNNPKINYRNSVVPVENIRVYVDFLSLIKSKPKIKKINMTLKQLDIKQLKKISINFKPSNLTSYINNKIIEGKLNAKLEIYLDNNNLLDNFIARGLVSNLKAKIIDDIKVEKTNFSFFADKTDVLAKNIFSKLGPIEITEGDLRLKLSSEILIESNFKTDLKYNRKLKDNVSFIKNFKYGENINFLNASLKNSFNITFDNTYKVKKYDYQSNGKISKATYNFKKPLQNNFFNEKINELSLIDSEIKTNFSTQKKTTSISGKYSINKDDSQSFSLENIISKDLLNLKVKADYSKPLEFEIINYKKPNKSIANISLDLNKQKDIIAVNKIKLKDGNNSILVEGVDFDKNKFLSLKKILVKTFKKGKKNNHFSITYGKKIIIKGSNFDARNLPKFFNRKTEQKNFTQINKDIEIDLTNIIAPLSENLKNFKLIGKIKKGKFTKISSKGDFGENKYLDITLKNNFENNKKYLEIYSDLTKPLLTEYSFFKGLAGGKLLYTSVIDEDNSISKLKIENFKLINAPGVVKLLSLSDLGGLADLAEGEGLSFDTLEIIMEKNKDLLKLKEILALGPSISVLMEGYQNSTTTSLRGTLVPAKTLNKMISKIPILGDIIIPKEIGEGLFGISFKIKGPPGETKTSINPIRTITPRFLQKIIDKNKKIK